MFAPASYRLIVLLLLLANLWELFGQVPEENEGKYVADFLPGRFISCLYQDSEGYLWAGSLGSLYRYDASRFVTFSHREEDSLSLSQGLVRTIFEDQQGALWIGTDKGLNCFDKAFEQFQRLGTVGGETFEQKVSAICEDNGGRLWVGTEVGLYILDKTTDKLNAYKAGDLDASVSITDMKMGKEGDLWIGTEALGLFRLKDGGKTLEHYAQQNGKLESNAINCIHQTRSGELYIATDFGVALFDKSLAQFHPLAIPDSLGAILRKSEVETIAEDISGKLWLGTNQDGLFSFDPVYQELRSVPHFSSNTSATPNDLIYSLLVDRSGLLWIGTFLGGLHAYLAPQKKFSPFQRASSTQVEVYSVFEDNMGNIWLGTSEGLEVYGAGGKLLWQSDFEVSAIMQDHADHIWLGTVESELKKCEQIGAVKHIDLELPAGGVNDLLEDAQQRIWIATPGGLVLIDEKGKEWGHFHSAAADSMRLEDDDVHGLFMDKGANIWIGTNGGLYRFYNREKARRLTPFKLDTEVGITLQSSSVFDLKEDDAGDFWIATSQGLVQLSADKKKARLIRDQKQKRSPPLCGLLFDAQGDLWASSEKGLWRLKTAPFTEEIGLVTYQEGENELFCDVFNIRACHRIRDNRLILGCQDGAVVFRPEEVWQNVYQPPVVLTSFKIGLEEVDFRDPESPLQQHIAQTKKIVLSPGLYRITLGFSALNFVHPEANRFRYKMEKVDNTWIFDRGNLEAEYPLSSGNYVFHLQAANNDGAWNTTGRRLEIIIQRPFTQTVWFYLLCLLLLVVGVVTFVRVRTRQLEQTQRKLEVKVAERTEEVNKKNEALEKTLQELKEAQTQLVEQEKMASLGQLTAGVAHEINNPITFVSGNITPLKRDISEMMEILQAYEEEVEKMGISGKMNRVTQLKAELDYEFLITEIRQLLDGIQEGAERTAEIVRGLRNFSRLDEDVLKLADVNQGIESTLLLLRSELKDRIEIVRDMPDMPPIMCYPGKLNGVYMNILTNGMQAIEGNGKIFITTRHLGHEVHISIRDTGKGMSETVQKRIFEPFFTTKDVGLGTGLGLSITYGAIERHGGRIAVKSKIGEGTEFLIVLPVKEGV